MSRTTTLTEQISHRRVESRSLRNEKGPPSQSVGSLTVVDSCSHLDDEAILGPVKPGNMAIAVRGRKGIPASSIFYMDTTL